MTQSSAPGRSIAWIFVGILLLSGLSGLGYQVIWVRMLAIGLGHEVLAVLAVIAAFFAGLAVGAWALDRPIARSRHPWVWYAGLEVLIGIWALVLIWAMPLANGWIADWMGADPGPVRRWAVAFLGPFLLLMPATAAMGATLPAAERALTALAGGRWVGALYAANTGGAMIGALATALWLAPALGYTATLVVFASVNLLAAMAMALVAGRTRTRPQLDKASLTDPTNIETKSMPPKRGLTTIALTGFLGIGFEVAGVRALSQMLENTVYSFAAALSVYLLATALGAAAWQRTAARGGGALPMLAALTGLGAILGTMGLFAVPVVYDLVRGALGPGLWSSLAAELTVATLVFGPASFAMGALFTHLAQHLVGPDGGLGRAIAANTGAAALAPFAIGIIAVPSIGVVATMVALALGYGLVALAATARTGRLDIGTAGTVAASLALTGATMLGPFDHRLVEPPAGGRVVRHVEGISGSASIVETARGTLFLRVNGTFTMGGTASYRLDRLQAHLALMQHPDPKSALFLGVGTGATLAAVADHPDLHAVAVDLSPEVLALVPEFSQVQADLDRAAERVQIRTGDARRAVRVASPGSYDVVLADTYHPAKDGAGLLYTVEHFRAIKTRLAPGGLFVQWLPLHQLDMPTLRLIVRSFLAVYPDARLAMGNYNLPTPLIALYGTAGKTLPSPDIPRARVQAIGGALQQVGITSPLALYGGMIAGPDALRVWVGEGPLNTDHHPLVMYRAPDTVYAPLPPAGQRLLALTEMLEIAPDDTLDLSGLPPRQVAAFSARLTAYWQARDRFLALGLRTRVTGDVVKDAERLVPALLQVLSVSPDFAPARQAVDAVVTALKPRHPALAATLEARLRAVLSRRSSP